MGGSDEFGTLSSKPFPLFSLPKNGAKLMQQNGSYKSTYSYLVGVVYIIFELKTLN